MLMKNELKYRRQRECPPPHVHGWNRCWTVWWSASLLLLHFSHTVGFVVASSVKNAGVLWQAAKRVCEETNGFVAGCGVVTISRQTGQVEALGEGLWQTGPACAVLVQARWLSQSSSQSHNQGWWNDGNTIEVFCSVRQLGGSGTLTAPAAADGSGTWCAQVCT